MVEIIRLDEATETLYESYVRNHPHGMLYYSLRFRNLLTELLNCIPHYLLAVENGNIQGVLPIMIAEGPAGRILNSLPYYGSHGGPLAHTLEAENALIGAFNSLANDQNVLSATLIVNLFEPLVSVPEHTHTDHRIGQVTDLTGDYEAHFEPSARRNVKKALAQGIRTYTNNTTFSILQDLHQENIRAIGGLPKSNRFFELIHQHFVAEQDYEIYVAEIDGEIIGALLLFYYRDTVEYFTPATKNDARTLQPLPLILHRAMRNAANRGFRQWNWGGTWETQTGVYRFKRKWGASDHPYQYYVRINDPDILGWPKERFLAWYPNFYVAPFSSLRQSNSDSPEKQS